jgi:hypothetical protein
MLRLLSLSRWVGPVTTSLKCEMKLKILLTKSDLGSGSSGRLVDWYLKTTQRNATVARRMMMASASPAPTREREQESPTQSLQNIS